MSQQVRLGFLHDWKKSQYCCLLGNILTLEYSSISRLQANILAYFSPKRDPVEKAHTISARCKTQRYQSMYQYINVPVYWLIFKTLIIFSPFIQVWFHPSVTVSGYLPFLNAKHKVSYFSCRLVAKTDFLILVPWKLAGTNSIFIHIA